MIEKWAPVQGWRHYEVSTRGRVRSLARQVGHRMISERILKPSSSGPYVAVSLHDNCRTITASVHVMVLQAFVGDRPFAGAHARHLDDDKSNNNLYNLAWGSAAENQADAKRIRYASCRTRKGYKLNPEAAKVIRFIRGSGRHARRVLAGVFKVTYHTITRVERGEYY